VYGQLPPAWTEQRSCLEDPELRRLVPREVAAAAAAAVALAVAVAGCGGAVAPGNEAGPALGRTVESVNAGAPSQATPVAATSSASTRPATAAPEQIKPPPDPSRRSPRSRAVLNVATRFADAYLEYQIGRHPPPVSRTIAATCTPALARLLLSRPAVVPPGERGNPAYQPAALTTIAYTGAASLGSGPPAQIVIADYRTLRGPHVGGRLTIELTPKGNGWRVSSLG
jgi:hypothetical protein